MNTEVKIIKLAEKQATAMTPLHVPSWKRCLDVGLITVTAPVWLPVMAGIGAMIKMLSPGPVLFKQERLGLGGNRFVCFKFRTMHAGAATSCHEQYLAELMRSNRPMTKLDGDDSRLIPLAWIIRSTGLDELPQLFNVLRGEMSLVGPRPCTPKEFASYSVPQRARLGATPGLTGLWQVSGKNHTTFDEMIELDIRYLRTHCLWLDLGIILRTPVVLFEQLAESLLDRRSKGASSSDSSPAVARDLATNTAGPVGSPERGAFEEVVMYETRSSCAVGGTSLPRRHRRAERRRLARMQS